MEGILINQALLSFDGEVVKTCSPVCLSPKLFQCLPDRMRNMGEQLETRTIEKVYYIFTLLTVSPAFQQMSKAPPFRKAIPPPCQHVEIEV